ncbi:MAG: signal peptidase I, partial [Halieaceae bacterium]|nr:signal peptidase I [Halieaceae bacterium]
VRQESASPLPSNVLDFATPEGHWLYARASAGPSDRRVTATLRDDPERELLLQIDGPAEAVTAAEAWCKRILERQKSLGVAMIGSCDKKSPTTIQFVPAEVDPQNAVALAMAARSDLFENYDVHGPSMLPGVRDGDAVFVDKSHENQVPPRGTIVIFKAPDGRNFIKRIVGLPGEKLELLDGAIRIDGKEFRGEPAADSEAAAACGVRLRQMTLGREQFEYLEGAFSGSKVVQIPDGHVYVLGDNRPISKDSRSLGPIPINNVAGIGTFITWSTVGSGIDWARSTTPLK